MNKPKSHKHICIVGGAGHVGLPLALIFAHKKYVVTLYDVNTHALEIIRKGQLPHSEENAEPLLKQALEQERLKFASSLNEVSDVDVFIITIGTPVDEFMNPELKSMQACIDDLLPHLTNDHVLILRSTVYPGTTHWLHTYLHAKGKDPTMAFCPERVVQGKAIEEIQSLPQIVAGTTPEATQQATELFQTIVPETVPMAPMEAEFAKLFSNAYRYIHFAIANQFYMLASNAGVDYNRILDGLQKNYARAHSIPRAGFAAGPCLLKDTMQLLAFSNNQFTLGNAAMSINEGLILHIANELQNAYAPLDQRTVGLLGMAFKADSDDTRISLSYKLKKTLSFRAKNVITTDPHVVTDPDLLPLDDVIDLSDVLILCVPHTAYRNLDVKKKPILDIWGYLSE